MTLSKRTDTLICHTTMHRHSINFLYHVTWSFDVWKYFRWQMLVRVQRKNTTELRWSYRGSQPFTSFRSSQHSPPSQWQIISTWLILCSTLRFNQVHYHPYLLHAISFPGKVLPCLGTVGRFLDDDARLWDFRSDLFPILYLIIIWLTPSFCRKKLGCLYLFNSRDTWT